MYKDNGPNSTNIQCNGNYWYVGTCGSGPGISVTPTTSHSCSCKTNNVWTVRPNIGSTNNNWGGVGKECNAPSQTLTVILGKASSNSGQTDNLNKGLVGFYKFDGDANDNTSNANHGTVNGPTLTTGKDNISNSAYSFDGDDDFIELPSGLLTGTGDFSISLWLKTSSTVESRILQQRDSNGFNGEYMLDLKSNGKLKLITYKDSYKWSGTTTSVVNDSNWHHIYFVQKDNGGNFYLNGILEFSDNISGKVDLLTTLKTYIGGDKRDNNKFFSGEIDELRIYNRALNVSEILQLYTLNNNSIVPAEPGGYAKVTDGYGGKTDNSGGGGTGAGGGGWLEQGTSNNWAGGGDVKGGNGGTSNYFNGGFGGGGAAYHGGGGGGGYTGGGGGTYTIDAGNGGSYNSGTERENYSEFNTGEGKLEITNLSSNETWVFSNASSTGNLGPIQSEIDSAYTSTNLNGNVSVISNGIQTWSIPSSGNYLIKAYGAQGGDRTTKIGKKGAKIIGQFNLNQGDTLNIIVGQSGEDSDGGVKGGGGGGGTFVYINNSETPLIIAGGGGGISYNSGN
jgi:hypothetical protein